MKEKIMTTRKIVNKMTKIRRRKEEKKERKQLKLS